MQPHLNPGPGAIPTSITKAMVATPAAIVNKGASMNRITTGLFRPKKKRMAFMVIMVCYEEDCGHVWNASRIRHSCPKCASRSVILMDKIDPEGKGILKLGKVKK